MGEIDNNNSDRIFLTKVKGIIKLKNKTEIIIASNFGKYNINNLDTIFSQNVLINYLNKKITGDYLDFSIERNSMIISKNVIYSDLNSTLNTDVIEIDIKTQNAKLFMYENEKKISIKTKN